MLSLLWPVFWPLIAIAIPLALLTGLLKTPWVKGHVGECQMRVFMHLLLPRQHYHSLHNVTLASGDGTTQIDHLVVSRFGVFVMETKNMRGWIFGSEQQAQWTQKIYRRSYPFQNPLRQNYKHLKAVQAVLELPDEHLHSIVNFIGGSRFKTAMPPNVTQGIGFIALIKSFTAPALDPDQVSAALQRLQQARLAPSLATQRQHVRHLQQRSDPDAQRSCPRCGSPLVVRTVRTGNKAGEKFWGCSTFPKCRTLQKM